MSTPDLSTSEKATVERFGLDKPARRTKRRYAYELFPHAEEDETRPLAVEVPYLYAQAIGFELSGTSWSKVEPRSIGGDRVMHMIAARQIAFMADAMLQGMTGDEAWKWADERATDETGEWVGERSGIYGVPYDDIKPYPCGPEPDHHSHMDEPDARGWRTVHRIPGKESECDDCTEPVESAR